MRRCFVVLLFLLSACHGSGPTDTVQGYVEGEYLLLGPVMAGRLERVGVAKGDVVTVGHTLFVQDDVAEQAALAVANSRQLEATARLENLLSGLREDEIEAIAMQKAQAEASLRLSRAQMQRQQELLRTRAVSRSQVDAAQAAVERDEALVAEAGARLRSARLAARPAEIDAARAAVVAAEAAVGQARWALAQRTGQAPRGGRVEELLHRPGEVVGAGQPVVSLLPPENVTVRLYAAAGQAGRLLPGQRVGLACVGCPDGLTGTVAFVASEAVYAPPVLYSRDGKEKLVFRVEVMPERHREMLRPGQPVTVTLSGGG